MKKTHKIIYWIATVWLSLGMLSTGIVQLIGMKEEIDFVVQMGYPAYFLTLLGLWKILGAIAILVPRFPLVKEWAYAGFFFSMTGAIFSHIMVDHSIEEMFGPLLLLVLTATSWYFRPSGRKVQTAIEKQYELQNG